MRQRRTRLFTYAQQAYSIYRYKRYKVTNDERELCLIDMFIFTNNHGSKMTSKLACRLMTDFHTFCTIGLCYAAVPLKEIGMTGKQ